ncbi:MAG: amino acid adenylation domain-containing protein [Verrucomicrobiota bacterium]
MTSRNISQRIADLSPAQRIVLESALLQKQVPGHKKPSIFQRRRPSPVPLSFAQQRLWFLDRLVPDSSLYNIPKGIRLRGHLNLTALRDALDAIVARHESLRTTFVSVEGNPVQAISDKSSIDFSFRDLNCLPEEKREEEVQRLFREESERPFDLATGPLFRAKCIRMSSDDHALFLTLHHIVCDGWSMRVLFRELAALYDAFTHGKYSPLADLPIQYADYAVWQRQWLQGEVLESQLSYWKKQLGDGHIGLELPIDRPRPSTLTFKGAANTVHLPHSLSESLRSLSRQEGVTLFMTLLTGFQTLLHRYTEQDDISVGSPIAGRNRTELESLIGCFVNTLVLRVDVSGNPTFRELLRRVRDASLGADAHQDIPFEKLVEELHPQRDIGSTPLFQVMFVLQNATNRMLDLRGLSLTSLEAKGETAKFDLTLSVLDSPDGMRASFIYKTDLFDAETIARMQGHLQTLLEAIVANPSARLRSLPILTVGERKQLLVEWNDTQTDYPRDHSIPGLFEAQVAQTPDAVALVFQNQQLTYQELNRRANQVAHHLRKLGVGPEVLVGISIERSLEMVIGLLGILKAGGAYVPLDPAYPDARLAFMLEDTRTPVVLTEEKLRQKWRNRGTVIVCLDTEWANIAQNSDQNPSVSTTPNDLAYVIYTSGSSGRPKGVAIEHHSVIALVHWARQAFTPEELAGVLASTSICFDLSIFELFVTLNCGGKVIIAENALQLSSLPAANEVTLVNTVPSAMAELLRAGGIPDSVRVVNLAGELLPARVVDQIYQSRTIQKVYDLYGPTETTVYSTFTLRKAGGPSTIGRPLSNEQIYLLSSSGQPVPVGVAGEIYIGGDGLARGYLHRPELTAEKFVPNPFGEQLGARLYKTGDLARYLPDGNVEFLGRIDNQVKIRGYRIEAGEIESVLRHHSAVRETAVVARQDSRVVAYLVCQKSTALATKEIRDYLKQKLPDYMVPSGFVFIEKLPLTPNGKVDRKALAALETVRSEKEVEILAPRDTLEFQLKQLWENVLGVRPISVADNFFDLGGHSLLAVRLFGQMEKLIGRPLPLATLFQAPTIEQIANFLREDGWVRLWSSLVPIQPGGSMPPIFFAHGVGGNVLNYYALARHLGRDQPVYGLQSWGLDGKTTPLTRVEDMAAHYLKEIRVVQPEGPYLIGGMSFGGVVAYEMAQQLLAQGQQVGLLALLDVRAWGFYGTLARRDYYRLITLSWLRRIKFHFGNLAALPIGDKLTYLRQKGKTIKRRINNRRFQKNYFKYLNSSRELPRALQNVKKCNFLAAKLYRPKPYTGRITVFQATDRLSHPIDPQIAWKHLALGGVDAFEVPGDHLTLVDEPHVRVLAEKLKGCIGYIHRSLLPDAPAAFPLQSGTGMANLLPKVS